MTTDFRGKILRFIFLIGLFFQIFFLSAISQASADSTYSPSNYYPISGSVKEGHIISFFNGKYKLSSVAYDQFMLGTVTDNPAITQDISGPTPFYPVITTGEGYVLVSTINGPIKKGDYITSSTMPGIGQKASVAGYTVGVANEDYSASNPKSVGKISISINIHYFIGNVQISSKIMDILSLSALATYESPSLIMKYIIASIIIGLGLIFCFILVTRTANKGIDALGRNPLSSFEIHIGIALNIFIAIMILVVGLISGFLVLRL